MPSFTGGRADFPLFPQAVCLLGSGKDNRWAGLPEKAQSVVPPRTGYRERMSEQRGRHGVGVKSGNPPGSLCPGSHSLPPHSKHPTPILSGPFRLLRTPLLAQSYLKWSFCAAPGGHQHLPTLIPAPGALQRGGTSVIKSIGLESRCPRERAGSHPCTQAWCLERVQVGGER